MKPQLPSQAAAESWRAFLSARSGERVFRWPIQHPSQPTGFCPCDLGLLSRAWFYFRAGVLLQLLKWPFNSPKLALLRHFGAQIGRRVYISADVWIDPLFPQLLTVEDDVMIGVGARIALHEFARDHFSAGRVIIRRGAVIGGFALIRHGVEIGENAVVVGGAVVGRNVPPGMMAFGNPARIRPLTAASNIPGNDE